MGSMRRELTTYTVDFSNIADPSRNYYAHECWVELDRGIVGIFFAQKQRSKDTLRSLVCIHMAPMYAVHWLKNVEEIQSPSIEDIAKICGAVPEKLIRISEEAEQAFEASANVVKTGMSGHDVTLDFIKFSPFSISESKSGKLTKGDPQIRIDLRASLFLGLIESLREMISALPSDASIRAGE